MNPENNIIPLNNKGLIGKEKKKPLTPVEQLRKLALTLNPDHGDKLYPLEVLGAYHIVNISPASWDFSMGGNPETFVDDQITKWMASCDIEKFKNRLERNLDQNATIRKTFLLRLNYALLMEEGKDEINIHRGATGELNGADIEDVEGLDEAASAFYSSKELLSSKKTGVKLSIRQHIEMVLTSIEYNISDNLDEVYYELNKTNAANLEEGLVARIAYMVFQAEVDEEQAKLGSDNTIDEQIKIE